MARRIKGLKSSPEINLGSYLIVLYLVFLAQQRIQINTNPYLTLKQNVVVVPEVMFDESIPLIYWLRFNLVFM